MQHIWASFNKNTSTYEISEIEIKKISFTHYHFSQEINLISNGDC